MLKWWIKYLGRSYFEKEIIDTITGDMSECCGLEQRYILRYNAISDPNFLNMNGGRVMGRELDRVLSLDHNVVPATSPSSVFVKQLLDLISKQLQFFSEARKKFATRVLSLSLYGFLRYDQLEYEYNPYSQYGSCDQASVEIVLNAMVSAGMVDLVGDVIVITDQLIDSIPDDVNQFGFKIEIPKGL